jgi:hypothetical protein
VETGEGEGALILFGQPKPSETVFTLAKLYYFDSDFKLVEVDLLRQSQVATFGKSDVPMPPTDNLEPVTFVLAAEDAQGTAHSTERGTRKCGARRNA